MKTFILLSLLATKAFALPEHLLGTRTSDKILPALKDTSMNVEDVRKKFSVTDIEVLDKLWDSRIDYYSKGCLDRSGCQIVSRFDGKTNDHPVVLLPGFTGYRKMNIEQAFDLLEQGFGPVYILDFRGYGETITNSKPLKEFVALQKVKTKNNLEEKLSEPELNDEHLKSVIKELPIGLADQKNLEVHAEDINFVMRLAVKENPRKKIVINAHSTGSMYLMLALGQRPSVEPWIKSVSRIVLESPCLRVMSSDKFIPLPYAFPISEVMITIIENIADSSSSVYSDRSVPEFVTKATGGFKEGNSLTHSRNRLSLTDSLRVYNGAETAGAAWSWVKASIDTHFDLLLPGAEFKKLNKKFKRIHKNLKDHKIGLVAVATDADTIANPKGTYVFMERLEKLGNVDVKLCRFRTAGHGLYVESDKYRDPYMQVLFDQKEGRVREAYGSPDENEILYCGQP